MYGPDTEQTLDQEQSYTEAHGFSPPNEDQGESTKEPESYEERVDDAITGVMEEDEEDIS